MASTYTPIATQTLLSSAADFTFINIPQTYTDLRLVITARSVDSTAAITGFLRLGNGSIDTGSNYSHTRLLGNGSTATSGRASNNTQINWDAIPGSSTASGTFSNAIFEIQNYSNTSTYKTTLIRSNIAANYVEATVGLWRSTSAINQIRVWGDYANLDTGSTATLYGIKAA